MKRRHRLDQRLLQRGNRDRPALPVPTREDSFSWAFSRGANLNAVMNILQLRQPENASRQAAFSAEADGPSESSPEALPGAVLRALYLCQPENASDCVRSLLNCASEMARSSR